MLNTAKLRGIIAERGLSQAKVACAISIDINSNLVIPILYHRASNPDNPYLIP